MTDKPLPAPLAEPWASMPGAESTSAALRRVQAENEHLRSRVTELERSCGDLEDALSTEQEDLEIARTEVANLRRVQAERDQLAADCDRIEDANLKHMEQRDLARCELDAVRVARDNLDRQHGLAVALLAGARRALQNDAYRLCPRCGDELDAEVAAETQPDEGAPPA